MDALTAYMPADRRQALLRSERLPEQTHGAALFADISGFTPLTEGLALRFGLRRGAEELTRLLNEVYDALITEVDRYAGSVISFSGDAITCWFDDQGPAGAGAPVAALRATACALALQTAMSQFAAVALPDGTITSLTLKVVVTAGAARRFAVGDPALQILDVLAGTTVARLALADHLALKGEVLLDTATIAAIGLAGAPALEWRVDEPSGERFAAVRDLQIDVAPTPWLSVEHAPLDLAQVRSWSLPAVSERIEAGLGEFLTELRPAVALFLRFGGIDYDADADAPSKLDAFIRQVQVIIERYAGALLQLTVGDKGSYLYAAFGAPIAHEDDARRAVMAALELRSLPDELPFITPVQIGISRGTMRTGAYGGTSRRTYGSLGNEVNVSARLMQHAAPGEVLASAAIYHAAPTFVWDVLPPIRVKGKSEPIPIARLNSAPVQHTAQADFNGRLIGRASELHTLQQLLAPLAAGQFAGVLSIYGEPGIGKSRLLHELHQQLQNVPGMATPRWFTCPTDELLRQSLSPFRYVLRAYAEQDLAATPEHNRAHFDVVLDALIESLHAAAQPDLAQELQRTRSFLGALVDLHWDGSLYEQLEPKLRFENTLAAIKALVLAESRLRPVVVQIEDAQWLDDDSRTLLALLTRNANTFPFAVLVSSRYHDNGSAMTLDVDAGVPQHALDLQALGAEDICAVASQTLGGDVDDALATMLRDKTDGNPFFAEQLALDLHERGVLRRGADGRWMIVPDALSEVPPTINVVLIARLDRLAAQVKAVVQMAAVLGQEFEVRVLSEMLQDDRMLKVRVHQAEENAIWHALDELRYLFRHALLRDAAYSMQLWARLRALHALAAESLGQVYADDLTTHAADLVYHYGKAGDVVNERHYARVAGEHAAAQFANADAVTYFNRALELTPPNNPAEQFALLQARERVYDLQGAREAQSADLNALHVLAGQLGSTERADVVLRHARYADVTGDYPVMIAAAQEVIALAAQIANNAETEAAGYLHLGRALWYQGAYSEAETRAAQALERARAGQSRLLEADSLRVLGNLALYQSQYPAAQQRYEQAVQIQGELGDRQGESATRNNLGIVAWYQGDYSGARAAYAETLRIKRETGDRYGQSLALLNLGEVAAVQGDYAGARAYYEQTLQIKRETDDRYGHSVVLSNLGDVALTQGDHAAARAYYEQALSLCRSLGHRQQESWVLGRMALLLRQVGDYTAALEHADQSLLLANEINDRNTQGLALSQRAHARAALQHLAEAAADYQLALELRRVLGQPNGALEALAGLAYVALVQGDQARAAAYVADVRAQLESRTIEGIEEPGLMYLICYRVLSASGDPAAATLLQAAHALLLARAEQMGDSAAQHMFLHNVPAHRELITTWEQRPPQAP